MTKNMGLIAKAVKRNTPTDMRLEDQTILLYGREKIGKTTLASKFQNILFLATEKGYKNIECDRIDITSWLHYDKALDILETEQHDYDCFAIDTLSKLWKYGRNHAMKVNSWTHEQDAGYGRGYDAVKDQFAIGFDRLLSLGKGVILIAHDTTEELTKPSKIVHYTKPRLDKRCLEIVEPEVEMILFADTETSDGETRRVLRTKRTEYHSAGDRSGRLPDVIDLSYEALSTGYNGGN